MAVNSVNNAPITYTLEAPGKSKSAESTNQAINSSNSFKNY